MALDYDRTCGGNVSLLLLLPDDGFASITAYVKNILTTRAFERVLASLAPTIVNLSLPRFRLELTLPDLIGPLTNLGIRDLFDRNRADLDRIIPTATMPPRVIVSKIIQKVVIEVNEQGTDPVPNASAPLLTTSASAGTLFSTVTTTNALPVSSMYLGGTSSTPSAASYYPRSEPTLNSLGGGLAYGLNGFNRAVQPKQFHANRPFVWALVSKGCSQEILMMGVLVDPRPVLLTHTLPRQPGAT